MASCNLKIPQNALTLQGMLTPYILSTANGNMCDQQAFVEITIVDTDTGNLFIYRPVVINQGTQPLLTPTPFTLPNNFIAGIWFGFNGAVLTLTDANGGNDLKVANCVNGITAQSPFGQFAYCNAIIFFKTIRTVINQGLLVVPTIQTARDGGNCPTSRDFMIVDTDQSDNLITSYLMKNGATAQDTPANRKSL